MIDTTRQTWNRHRRGHLEGWIEQVDPENRSLHIRRGSRDRIGLCLRIPLDCTIQHDGLPLHLQSLLPCDPITIFYQEDAQGDWVVQQVEMLDA